ncbi:Kcnh5, partial [Symbiodinium sp. KB8]
STARGVEWEHRCDHICAHYLRTWFALDFVTIIPFDIFSLAFGTDNLKELKSIKVVRALRLLKLMRMLKSSRLLHKLEIALSIPYQHFALIRFLFGLVLVCHWLSCFWAMCLHLVNDDIPKWIDGIAASDARFGIETSPIRVYIASFYFCSYTMTSVGYGDLGPQNLLERIVCTIIVLVAGLCWAQILGEVCAISSDMNAETSAFRKKMNSLNMMMQEQGLPHDLRRRLRSFFLQNRHQAQYVVRQKLLDNMSPQLQSEVCTEMQFMAQIEIAESRGIDTDPYRQAKRLKHRARHTVAFSIEDFVLSDTSLIRPVGGFALTYIEVLFLTRESFMQVIERRRLTCPQLGRIVRRYCIRVAVRRGVIYEAKRIARQRRREERQRRMEEQGDVPSSIEVPPLPPEQQDVSCPSQSLPGMPEVRA